MKEVTVTSQRVNGFCVIAAAGEFDYYTSPVLREALANTCRTAQPRVIVDLSGVTFMDSSALGALVATRKQVRAGGGSMSLVGLHGMALKTFQITALTRVFDMCESIEQAMSGPRVSTRRRVSTSAVNEAMSSSGTERQSDSEDYG